MEVVLFCYLQRICEELLMIIVISYTPAFNINGFKEKILVIGCLLSSNAALDLWKGNFGIYVIVNEGWLKMQWVFE